MNRLALSRLKPIQWWQQRSGRERRMLGFLGVLLVLLVGWYGLYRPLMQYKDAAAHRNAVAQARLHHLVRQQDLRAVVPAQEGRAAMEQAARDAGVNPQLDASDAGIAFTLSRAPRQAGLAWLAGLADAGLVVTALRLVPHDDGTLTLTGAVGSNLPQ